MTKLPGLIVWHDFKKEQPKKSGDYIVQWKKRFYTAFWSSNGSEFFFEDGASLIPDTWSEIPKEWVEK
jgi:hypothetical protein